MLGSEGGVFSGFDPSKIQLRKSEEKKDIDKQNQSEINTENQENKIEDSNPDTKQYKPFGGVGMLETPPQLRKTGKKEDTKLETYIEVKKRTNYRNTKTRSYNKRF